MLDHTECSPKMTFVVANTNDSELILAALHNAITELALDYAKTLRLQNLAVLLDST